MNIILSKIEQELSLLKDSIEMNYIEEEDLIPSLKVLFYFREEEKINMLMSYFPTYLSVYCSKGQVELLSMSLKFLKDYNFFEKLNWEDFHGDAYAAENGSIPITKILLEYGLFVLNGNLGWAVMHGHRDFCQFLLDQGANPETLKNSTAHSSFLKMNLSYSEKTC